MLFVDGYEEVLRQTTENNPKVLGIYIFTFFYWTSSEFSEGTCSSINKFVRYDKEKSADSDTFIVARDRELRNSPNVCTICV